MACIGFDRAFFSIAHMPMTMRGSDVSESARLGSCQTWLWFIRGLMFPFLYRAAVLHWQTKSSCYSNWLEETALGGVCFQ